MSISASQIVKITPRVVNEGSTELEIVGMYLTTNAMCSYPRTLVFESADSVGEYFGYASDEYKQATKYFLGYNNSFKKPRKVVFGRYVPDAICATYIGTGTVGSITDIQSITNGKIVFNIDGVRKPAVALNFSSVSTQSEVAQMLQSALPGVQVAYNTNLSAFVMTTTSVGNSSSIELVADGGGTEVVTIDNRWKLTDAAVADGYSVDTVGLRLNGTVEAKWSLVSANWDTYKEKFQIDANGNVYQYTWENRQFVCYETPTVESHAVASVLGMDVSNKWKGTTAKTPAENMNGIVEYNQNWVSFTNLTALDTKVAESKSIMLAFAKWANDTESEYLYCPYTTNSADINPSNPESITALLTAANYEGVILTFGTVDYATLVMSIGACIDWDRTNGLITYAFKQQDELPATIDNNTDAENANALKVNFYGNYATRNDQFIWYYQGSMIGGKFRFVDAYVGQLWLRNVLQVSIMNGLGISGRIPYTEVGYTKIRALCMAPINRALNNGCIENGVSLSESQKVAIMSGTGDNSAPDTIFLNGYYLQISDPSTSVRAERGTPIIGLWYTYGGSIHRIEVPVMAVL